MTKLSQDVDIKVEFKDGSEPVEPSSEYTIDMTLDESKAGYYFSASKAGEKAITVYPGKTKVPAGYKLTGTVTPNAGIILESYVLNGETIAEEREAGQMGLYYDFGVIKADMTIVFNFKDKEVAPVDEFTVTASASEGGSLDIYQAGLLEESGASFKKGASLEAYLRPDEGYEVTSLLVNDEEKLGESEKFESGAYKYAFVVNEDMVLSATFTMKTAIGSVSLDEASYNGAAQTLDIPAGAHAVVYNAAGQQVLNAAGGQTVSTAALADGAYILRVAADHAVKVVKFIKK